MTSVMVNKLNYILANCPTGKNCLSVCLCVCALIMAAQIITATCIDLQSCKHRLAGESKTEN